MKAFKGTDKNLKCQGFQYEIGKEYKAKGDLEICKNGFHACENPLDVFAYYPPDGNNKFFEVEQDGETKTQNDKTVSSYIKINTELSLKQFFEIGFKLIFDKVKKTVTQSQKTANTAGNKAHANTAGDEAIACALGIKSRAKAINGWIIIVDWQYKERWYIKQIYHAKVGGKIKTTKIKPDTWYWFEDGKLKSEK